MKSLNPKFYPLDDYNYEYLVQRVRDLCPAHIKVLTIVIISIKDRVLTSK